MYLLIYIEKLKTNKSKSNLSLLASTLSFMITQPNSGDKLSTKQLRETQSFKTLQNVGSLCQAPPNSVQRLTNTGLSLSDEIRRPLSKFLLCPCHFCRISQCLIRSQSHSYMTLEEKSDI